VQEMQARTGISERRACQLIGLSRSVLRYQPRASVQNTELQAQLVELAQERRRFGYRRLHFLLRRAGVQVNHKRIYRLYRAAGLMVKRRRRRHGVAVERKRLSLPSAPNQVWSMDFVFDALSTGRRIKCLTVVDDCGFHAIRPPSPRSSGQAFHGHLATCSTAIRPGSRSA
ncbi:IS3 family transposase, partial [Pseudomonas aeruginosa]|uniref:IS3 family transposase n=1 Tax=Pseudomonas aeruginosa TaxID=287 RepID=UPI0039842087